MSVSLTPDQIQRLLGAQADIDAAEAEITRAERAGLPMTRQRQQLEYLKGLREGLLREYGGQTPQPTRGARPRRS